MDDPVWKSARREAFTVGAWALAATAYSLIYCCTFGYGREGEPVRFVLGFPSWVFWGVVAPWLVSVAFSIWFALGFMTDERLDDDTPAEPTDG